LIDVGLRDSALNDLNEAVALDGKSRYVRGVRGTLLASLGRVQEAFDDFDHIVRRNPDDVAALVLRATMYDRLGKLDEAMADLRSAEHADANYARIYGIRGIILMS
jgi:Flp pilus assembly protein TadD